VNRSFIVAVLLAALSAASFADAGTTQAFTYSAGSYAGSRDRHYKVYTPSGLATPAPMVMALHGCEQTNDDVLNDWGLTAAADRYGFVLVAPFITSYDGFRNTNCWGFWLDEHRHQGRGEVEDLHRIAMQVETRVAIDPARRYITGLSSGAAMAVDEAIAYNEYWAAAASASGLPYGEDAESVSLWQICPGNAIFHPVSRVASDMRAELNNAYAIPLMVLQSNKDCVVVQPAGTHLRDAHLRVFGDSAHDTAAKARVSESSCTPFFQSAYGCRRTVYTGDGSARSLVETVFFNGPQSTPNPGDMNLGHYWVGGEKGGNGRYSVRNGPSYPDIVWDFFVRHARSGTAPHPGSP
jgi:poly(hydroxyalkanoate) depolymerase family esterase